MKELTDDSPRSSSSTPQSAVQILVLAPIGSNQPRSRSIADDHTVLEDVVDSHSVGTSER
jgi:hypothetical protein